MQPDDRTRLAHTVDACDEIGRFVAGRDATDVETDRMLLFALVSALEVGEAASGLTDEARERAPEIPWRQIVATRNRLIHGYFDVDPEIVRKTATDEVPALMRELYRVLEEVH